jgi:hypothetical protein
MQVARQDIRQLTDLRSRSRRPARLRRVPGINDGHEAAAGEAVVRANEPTVLFACLAGMTLLTGMGSRAAPAGGRLARPSASQFAHASDGITASRRHCTGQLAGRPPIRFRPRTPEKPADKATERLMGGDIAKRRAP